MDTLISLKLLRDLVHTYPQQKPSDHFIYRFGISLFSQTLESWLRGTDRTVSREMDSTKGVIFLPLKLFYTYVEPGNNIYQIHCQHKTFITVWHIYNPNGSGSPRVSPHGTWSSSSDWTLGQSSRVRVRGAVGNVVVDVPLWKVYSYTNTVFFYFTSVN